MELLERCRGFNAEFIVQLAARVPEGGQRIGLAAPVQGQHEQAAQPLPQRVLGGQIPQLRDQVAMTADHQVKLDAVLERAHA